MLLLAKIKHDSCKEDGDLSCSSHIKRDEAIKNKKVHGGQEITVGSIPLSEIWFLQSAFSLSDELKLVPSMISDFSKLHSAT